MKTKLHVWGSTGSFMRVFRTVRDKFRPSTRNTREVAVALVFIVFICGSAFGQSTGTINGRVVDATGGVIPDVTVTATNTGTNVVRSTATNSDGIYSFAGLEPAPYDVR